MATILISMFPEEGHLIPTFKIAKTLQAREHRIVYLALPDFEAYISAQGFEYLALFPEQFPKGSRAEQLQRMATARGRAFLKEVTQTALYRAVCEAALQAENPIKDAARSVNADLCIIDGFLAPMTVMLRAAGFEVMSLSVNINLPEATNYPPVVTPIIPEDTPQSASKARIAWKMSRFFTGLTARLVGFNFKKELQAIAEHHGFGRDIVADAALFPRLRPLPQFPEIIICPQVFDFPRPEPEPDVLYSEPSIDLARKDDDFPWELIDDAKPLVYCTLGSQSHIYKHSRQFFQTVIDTFAAKPDTQLVLAVGQHFKADVFSNVPSNVLVTAWAPSLKVLERAKLMITHGGVGSIKECLYFNVPMLVFPGNRDQPGYAARVAYHGLGVVGAMRGLTVQKLAGMLAEIETNPSYRERVQAMGETFRALEERSPAVELIEARVGREAAVGA